MYNKTAHVILRVSCQREQSQLFKSKFIGTERLTIMRTLPSVKSFKQAFTSSLYFNRLKSLLDLATVFCKFRRFTKFRIKLTFDKFYKKSVMQDIMDLQFSQIDTSKTKKLHERAKKAMRVISSKNMHSILKTWKYQRNQATNTERNFKKQNWNRRKTLCGILNFIKITY